MGLISCIVKKGLCLVSQAFIILGIVILLAGLGLYFLVPNVSEFVGDISSQITFVILLGVVTLILGIMGMAAAITKNFYILVAFVIAVVIMIVIQVYVVITIFIYADELSNNLHDNMIKKFPKIVKVEDKKSAISWHVYEVKSECCGIDGPEDYNKAVPGAMIAPTCCKGSSKEIVENYINDAKATGIAGANLTNPCKGDTLKYNGCYAELDEAIKKVYGGLKILIFVHMGINVLGVALASCLIINKCIPLPV